MGYTVTVQEVRPQWIAAARGPLPDRNIGAAMLGLLGQAWDQVKRSGIKTDGQNVAIYRGRMIEAGPRVIEPRDGCVATPEGLAAIVVHMGPYELLADVHKAIREWCAANGRQIEGTNWEIYGHHEEDPAKRRTDVFYLLRA
jgi:effector-binding domain-containing protein